jgi:hypothetical protein
LPVLKAEKTGPVTQENNASAFFGAANAINTMNFLDMHTLQEADHFNFGLCHTSDLAAVMNPGILLPIVI